VDLVARRKLASAKRLPATEAIQGSRSGLGILLLSPHETSKLEPKKRRHGQAALRRENARFA
jgi:hypothetical protein